MESKSNLLHERMKTAAPLFLTAVGMLLALQALVTGISSDQLYRDKTRCAREPACATVGSPKRAAKKLLLFKHCKALSVILTWLEITLCMSPQQK